MAQINIKVDQKRLEELVTIDEYFALLEGDVKTMVNVLSQFVVNDDGNFLEKEQGRKLIGQMTLNEMKDAVSAFNIGADNAVVPPPKGAE